MQSRLGGKEVEKPQARLAIQRFQNQIFVQNHAALGAERSLCASFCITAVEFPITAATHDVTPMA